MHYLGLALYAEGPTDYYFLSPLLHRLCEDLCLRYGRQPVEISDVLGLDHPAEFEGRPREERIEAAALSSSGAWNILFIHTDGANNPGQAHLQLVAPAMAKIASHLALSRQNSVAVVPVRETEAWTLADGDALRHVFGTSLDDTNLGLPPRIPLVEHLQDPKQVLDDAFLGTAPSGARSRRGVSAHLVALGNQVRLDRLRAVPSFLSLENNLYEVLQARQII